MTNFAEWLDGLRLVSRVGAARIRSQVSTRWIVEAPTRWPSLSGLRGSVVSPARVLPTQLRDQRDGRLVGRWTAGPVWVGPLPRYQTAMPDQDRAGRDSRCRCTGRRRSRHNAANSARSAPSRRASGSFADTRTSWRSTRSSASIDIEDRASNDNQPDRPTTIKHTRCKSTAPDHANRLATAAGRTIGTSHRLSTRYHSSLRASATSRAPRRKR